MSMMMVYNRLTCARIGRHCCITIGGGITSADILGTSRFSQSSAFYNIQLLIMIPILPLIVQLLLIDVNDDHFI